jgi:hypothetical protein
VSRIEVRDEDPGHGDTCPVGELETSSQTALDLDPYDRVSEPHLAAVVFEEAHHRLSKDVRAADADCPPVRLERAREHDGVVRAEPEDVSGARELGDPEAEPGLHLGRLEKIASDVVRCREEMPQQREALGGVLERADLLRRRNRRGEQRRDDALFEHLAVDVGKLAERLGVSRREAGDALRCALDAPAADDCAPVGEHVGELVLRPDVARAVALELEVPIHGAHMDDPVEVRVEVVPEAGSRDLLCRAAAAGDVAGLEHEHPLARLREVAGAGEPVVAPAHDDDVEALGDQSSSSQRCRACSHASAGGSSPAPM